jgi:DNA polymerase III epsilon subunit-like protein
MSDDRPWSDAAYLVVDVEGNGAHPPDLVELAAVPILRGQIGPVRSWLVQPDTPITPIARRIHGIRNRDVADQPRFHDVREQVIAALTADAAGSDPGGITIVGHNVAIDVEVLTRKLPGWRPDHVVDTLRMSRAVRPDLASHKLGALVDALDLAVDLPAGLTPHRAAYDALVAARLLTRLAVEAGGRSRTVQELRQLGSRPESRQDRLDV